MFKQGSWLLASLAALAPVSAGAYDLVFNGNDYGTFNATLKAHHVVSDAGNGFDPSNGTAYMVALKYATPDFDGLKLKLGHYTSGDLFGITDFDVNPSKERVARGMFINEDGHTDYQLGEILLDYKGDMADFQIGRSMLNTPLTKNAYSLTPNFYSSALATARPMKGLSLKAGLITEMSFGARAATDWGLIGERAPTAGAAINPVKERGGIGQGRFFDISQMVRGPNAPSTTGITVLNASYTGVENLTLNAWNYYADDIANSVYLDGDYAVPIKSLKSKLTFSAQYLRQRGVGDKITNGTFGGTNDDLDYSLLGGKVALGNKKWGVYGAFNSSSGDTWFLNAFGGDPAYTSTIFSRNAYRESVDAWKIGGRFSPMKGVNLIAQYADYGQSDSLGYFGPASNPKPISPQTDATELDLIAVYKPTKAWTLRLFYADRTSEYNGAAKPPGTESKQEHVRFIAQYDF
jgi:hypothetical protein